MTLILAMIVMGSLNGVVLATDIVVDLNSGVGFDYTTVGAAIDAAAGGDTITVRPGRYVENININGKAITLRSSDPTDGAVVLATIIDGNQAGSVITNGEQLHFQRQFGK